LFISLCPQDIVKGYLANLKEQSESPINEEVVDVEFKEKE